jgi:DeoR/GlpR family transcriptional regulator of sugar metabolism
MSQHLRQEAILDILKKQGYVPVKYLVDVLHYSNATINRDLNVLKEKGLITRSYGGVSLTNKGTYPSIAMRQHLMRKEKRLLAKIAAEQVCDGDAIFIDASTTAQFMAPYLINHKNITVITNNTSLVEYLSDHAINVVCLGGHVIEPPSRLCSSETVEYAARYFADKMFFSTGHVTPDGLLDSCTYDLLRLTMMKHSRKVYYLAEHNKVIPTFRKSFCDLSKVDTVISDYDFPEETKLQFPDTEFILVTEK